MRTVEHQTADVVLASYEEPPPRAVEHQTSDVVLTGFEETPPRVVEHFTADVVLAGYMPPAWVPAYVWDGAGWLPMFNPTGTPHDQ